MRESVGWRIFCTIWLPANPRHLVSVYSIPVTSKAPSLNTFYPRDPAQQAACERLRELASQLAATPAPPRARGVLGKMRARLRGAQPPVRGLYLWGGVGRGKTCLMDWFVEELAPAETLRVHFHHFMREVHARMAALPRQPDPLEVVAEQLRERARVLCLDECLVTDITDAMLLHGLLRALFSRGVTLVTTSNTPPEELYRNGLQRQRFVPAIELLKEYTEVFELDGGVDYRLRTLTRIGVFVLESEQGEAQLEQDFIRLSRGQTPQPEHLSINGREIPVRGCAGDVAWFDFAALCATPRAVADYIELAREFHTILLSGVPQLGPREEAAARRFLLMVDEFYDQRVKLVISAAVPLDQLYAGGLSDFAHERLLSRLSEMQSVEYLAVDVPDGLARLD